jgi:hypothetical protein
VIVQFIKSLPFIVGGFYNGFMYDQNFWLEGKKGNNAFSYELRKASRLYVPQVTTGSFDDLRVGKEVAFEDFEDGELKSCVGLENFVKMEILGTPAVVFDNHNHAFYFWHEWGAKGAALMHVDQHKDTREPDEWFEENAFCYTNEVLNVGNYILPAKRCGMVDEIVMITGGEGLKKEVREGNVILNLDLDFFVPEMEIDFELAREFLRTQAKKADFITVATSPFFIGQEKALEIFKQLFSSHKNSRNFDS